MLSAYVCRQCRVRLARRAAPTPSLQWQPRATYLSLRGGHAQADDPAQEPHDETHTVVRKVLRDNPSVSPISPPTSRYSKLVRQTEVDHDHLQEPAPAEESETEFSYAAPLEQALASKKVDGSFERCWNIFNEIYTSRDCKALTEPSPLDVKLMGEGRLFFQLLSRLNSTFGYGAENLPVTPTELLWRYEQLGIASPEYWARNTLGYLTQKAIESANSRGIQQRRDLPSLLREILSVWRLLFQCNGPTDSSMESISTEWHIPALDSLPHHFDSRNFCVRLQMCLPKTNVSPELGFSAVYLYTISDALKSMDDLHQEAAPLLQLLERLLAGSHVNSVFRRLLTPFRSLPQYIQERVTEELENAPRRALVKLGSMGVTSGGTSNAVRRSTLITSRGVTSSDPGDATSSTAQHVEVGEDQQVFKKRSEHDDAVTLEEFYLKRISRYVLSRPSSAVLESLWDEILLAYTQDTKVAIPSNLYDALLAAFLTLYNAPKSVQIWNHMIAHGVQPTSKTWTALLSGCAKAKDLTGLNAMWQRMLSAGFEPDEYAWTTRVHGLISMREIDLGIAALDEMGKKWLSAEQGPQVQGKGKKIKKVQKQVKVVNNSTKPTVEVVNGAITALVQNNFRFLDKRRVELVQKVLGWAKSFDIAPDIRTYNSLIQLYMSIGDHTTAFKILNQMEANGMVGDIATYTMLIGFAFDNERFDALSHAEQITHVISLLDSVEAGGVKLNDYIYSTVIDRLLKKYSNHDAVRAITEHMSARQIVTSAAIYTTVITHYFQAAPPDMASIDGLVHQILHSRYVPNDSFLFDRIIQGYAEHGEVGKMMSVLTRMSIHGNRPSWRILRMVVDALVKNDDYERANQVVQEVMAEKDSMRGSNTDKWQFLTTLRNHGLRYDAEENETSST